MDLSFTWDPIKDAANARKHGVPFAEAMTAFADPLSITIPHPDHSTGELRYLLVGLSSRRRLLVVAHVERGDQIRLISARPATRRERHDYEEES
jgi:hypothetical protein